LTPPELHLVVLGPLDQRTGGYIYDRRIVEGLRDLGTPVRVHSLQGLFPGPDSGAERALEGVLSGLRDGSLVVIDGLALGGLPGPAARHAHRLTLIGLVHHPLCEETGLSPDRATELEALERAALQSCRGIIATSRFTADRLREWLQPSPPLRVVVPGIAKGTAGTDPSTKRATAFVPSRSTKRAPPFVLSLSKDAAEKPAWTDTAGTAPNRGVAPQASNRPDAPLLLCVGSLIPRKGQDLLVQALAQLQDRPWHCLLAGSDVRDPVFAQQLRAQIARLGLDTRVEILGECPEQLLQDLYRRADLFALPAWYEGYGMAFTEAMAHGLPIIATTGGAIPCTVPAAAGILVPPGDIDRLAEAVAQLLEEPSLRARLARGAWDHARSLPGWEQVSAQFRAAVKELAGP